MTSFPTLRAVLLVLNFLLMVLLPVLLGLFVATRKRISWRFFGIGAVSFILAQVLHIPFNYLVTNRMFGLLDLNSQSATLLLNAVFLGLSAGLFEEGSRYIAYRYWAKDARTYGKGLMMGAGHGGAESILLGILGALNVIVLLGYRSGYFQGLVPEDQAPLVIETINSLVSLPWFETLFGALERVFALCIQLSLSLTVLQVFIRRTLRWLLLAIVWHSLIDAATVLAVGTSGAYVAEAIVGASALISLLIIFGLREPEPEPVMDFPVAAQGPARLVRAKITEEKLEDSRYI